MFHSRGSSWPVFTPFFVAIALVASMVLYPFTGIGPASNIFALCALVAIVIGLVVGVVSLRLAKTILVWWRSLIGVLYFPTVVFSLLLAGF